MPIREYQCENGHRTERIELSQKCLPLLACSTCGRPSTTSVMSVPAVVRIAGVGVISDRTKEHIKEPYWRDQETGRVTSMY